MQGIPQIRSCGFGQCGPVGQLLTIGLLPVANGVIKLADANDIGPQAVAQNHAADGNHVAGFQQVRAMQDDPHKVQQGHREPGQQRDKQRGGQFSKPQVRCPEDGNIRHENHHEDPCHVEPGAVQVEDHLQI